MAVGDCYRLTITMTHLGSTYLNVWGLYAEAANPGMADVTTVATAIKEAFRPTQSANLVYRSYRAVQVRGGDVVPIRDKCTREGGVVFEAAYTGTTSGGVASTDDLPPQSACVVTINTGKVGRRFRGRIYLPGFAEAAQTSGQFVPAQLTSIQTGCTTLQNAYSATGTDPTWQLGVWSERIATGCIPNAVTHHPENVDAPNLLGAFASMTQLIPRSTVFTQRRRTLGVGR